MRKITVVLLALGLCGCATMQSPMLQSFWIGGQPIFAYEKDSKVDFSAFKSFTVFAQGSLQEGHQIDPLVEKQILFIVRNQFEVLGYRYTDSLEEADFFISAYYSNEYRDIKTQDSKVEIPEDIPGKISARLVESFSDISSLTGRDYFHDAKDNWGKPLAIEPQEEAQPESEQTDEAASPKVAADAGGPEEAGEVKDEVPAGHYYPAVCVVILDKESKQPLWSGQAIGATLESQVVLSAQNLIRNLFWGGQAAFPVSRRLIESPVDVKDGSFGFFPHIRTTDGTSFYPFIGKVYLESPSYAQGLRPGDSITHMDGVPMLNLSFSQVLAGLDKAKGETLSLRVKKEGEIVDIDIIAEDEAVAKDNWQEYITEVY